MVIDSKIYSLPKPDIDKEYENYVVRMRLLKVKEDAKRNAERQQLALVKKKHKDKMSIFKPRNEKGTISGDYPCYNYEGRMLDVKLLTDFNNVVPKCRNHILNDQQYNMTINKTFSRRLKKKKELELIDVLIKDTIKKESINQIEILKLYERFVPNVGVELTEVGRKGKKSGLLIEDTSDKYGFLPDINSKNGKSILKLDQNKIKTPRMKSMVSKTLKPMFNQSVDVAGDLDQLIVQDNDAYYQNETKPLMSSRPKVYIPPLYRKYNQIKTTKNLFDKSVLQSDLDPFFVTSDLNGDSINFTERKKPIQIAPLFHADKNIIKQKKMGSSTTMKIGRAHV